MNMMNIIVIIAISFAAIVLIVLAVSLINCGSLETQKPENCCDEVDSEDNIDEYPGDEENFIYQEAIGNVKN